MPRFFFDVLSRNAWTTDRAGEVFADAEAAGDVALEILQSVARDEWDRTGAGKFAVRVRGEADQVCLEASFTLNATMQPR